LMLWTLEIWCCSKSFRFSCEVWTSAVLGMCVVSPSLLKMMVKLVVSRRFKCRTLEKLKAKLRKPQVVEVKLWMLLLRLSKFNVQLGLFRTLSTLNFLVHSELSNILPLMMSALNLLAWACNTMSQQCRIRTLMLKTTLSACLVTLDLCDWLLVVSQFKIRKLFCGAFWQMKSMKVWLSWSLVSWRSWRYCRGRNLRLNRRFCSSKERRHRQIWPHFIMMKVTMKFTLKYQFSSPLNLQVSLLCNNLCKSCNNVCPHTFHLKLMWRNKWKVCCDLNFRGKLLCWHLFRNLLVKLVGSHPL
jgi:hypothetical protein